MNYFRKILFALFLFSICSLHASYESEIIDIRAQGRGETIEEAILDAKVIALQSFAEFFSVKEELVNDKLTREIVALSVGAVSDYEVISSFKNNYGQTVVEIKAKLNKDSMQLVNLFPIDPDKASTNVNGEFYATENAKWRFNQKKEIEALNHMLEKVLIIGKKGFTQPKYPPTPIPISVGKTILQNRFYVDYFASENMNTVFEVVKKTLGSLSVTRAEYMTIPTREIFQIELCLDAMLFGNRFEKQKTKKRRGNSIPDCKYETYYLRNRKSIQMLQRIEDYVRSEIKSTNVIRQYNDNTCKTIPYSRYDEKKHKGIERIVNDRAFNICYNPSAIKALESKPVNKEEPYWPKVVESNKHNDESFSNNLTFNTCNVAYRKNERIFFPVSRQCRAQIPSCAIPYKNAFGKKENAAFGLNLPLGGELIARKTIIDSLKEADYYRLNKYKAEKNPDCN